MAGCVEVARRIADAPALTIGGKFKGFQPEQERSSSKAEVKENEPLRRMKAAWRGFKYDWRKFEGNYDDILQMIKGLGYCAKDVEEFSIALAEFRYEKDFSNKAGFFLSALINSGKDNDYIIHTRALPLHYIGFMNSKNITVYGDAGMFLGHMMESGSIVVDGSADSIIGQCMEGGSIIVKGDADGDIGADMIGGSITVWGNAHDEFLGLGMKGGIITVGGDAGSSIGALMEGGEIRLDGNYESLSDDIKGGRIYHKGNLIYPK